MDAGQSSNAPFRVTFDARVFALQSVKKAAYRLLKNFDTEITQVGDSWVCALRFSGPANVETMARAERELRAEVLDQDLRASIARETEPVRNAVLAMAFARTGLQGSE